MLKLAVEVVFDVEVVKLEVDFMLKLNLRLYLGLDLMSGLKLSLC